MSRIHKIFISLIAVSVLSACTAITYTPVIPTRWSADAVYKTGDFSYPCRISKTEKCVVLTVTGTRAKGMKIRCDGSEVSFEKDGMRAAFPKERIDITNPALVLYEAFSYLEDGSTEALKKGDVYEYRGTCSVGNYILIASSDSTYLSLTFPRADIEIEFT